MTDDEAWSRYERLLRWRRSSTETIRTYKVSLDSLWAFLRQHRIRWDAITPTDMEAWLAQGRCPPGKRNAGQPWGRATLHVYGRHTKGFYTEATEQGWLHGRNPLRDWRPPPEPAPRPRALSITAIGELVALVDPRVRMIVWFQYYQALRIGEVCRLHVEDVTLSTDPPMLRVEGKGDRETWMAISPRLLPHLRAFMILRPAAGPLIPNWRDPTAPLDPKYASHLLAAVMRPIVGDSGHALRHTAAQQLRRLTRDPYVVRDALRHSGLGTQATYVGADVELLAEALGQLPDPLEAT